MIGTPAAAVQHSAPVSAKDPRAQEILRFWFGDAADYGRLRTEWFRKDPHFDARIRERFQALYEQAVKGALAQWRSSQGDCLALVILLDQFPRNMFRDTAAAFATDLLAREVATQALERRFDAGLRPVERMFFYLPFEHSEAMDDQWRSLALMAPLAVWPEMADAFPYAVRHWEIVRRFGRYPHRNALLGRPSTPEEVEFLRGPGSSF